MSEIPVLPKAESIIIHTGNMVNWSRLKRKPNQLATEEILSGIDATLAAWKKNLDLNDVQYLTALECAAPDSTFLLINCTPDGCKETCSPDLQNAENLSASHVVVKFGNEERKNLKITVKIYLHECALEVIQEAVEKVLETLDTSYLETLLLSLPESFIRDFSLEPIKPVWEYLENLMDEDRIINIGFSDLSKDQLELIFNWAKRKPSIDQVNLASCCTMPEDLVEFAKENLIQLLTHSDPKDVLPAESFQKAIMSHFTVSDSLNWEPYWSIRYSSIVKGRGVINGKGYITKAKRTIGLQK